ncbi:MAG: ROK family transcriptional regulator [Brachybacterium sp.]|nr:ROK family transcriptional regulator [Brachybacterium sp.]
MRGSSMPDLGDFNEKLVLQAVRQRPGGLAQAHLVRETGLSRQAISRIVHRLTERGLLVPAGTAREGRGKPSTLLRVVPDSLLAAGVHVDPAQMRIAILGLGGGVVGLRDIGPPGPSALEDLDRVIAALGELCSGAGVARGIDGLLGIGVATPGGLDVTTGTVVDPPWLAQWRDVPVVRLIEERTRRPALVEKDTTAALTGELWAASRTAGTVLYVYVGSGVGSAVAVDGTVLRGAGGLAGEIGHLPTGIPGRTCQCGREGCLAVYTDLARLVTPAGQEPEPTTEPRRLARSLGEMLARADRRDPVALEALALHGRALGEAVGTLIAVHDPDRVIIGGPLWAKLQPYTLPEVRRAADRDRGRPGTPAPVESSSLGDEVGALGAASVVLDSELAPRGWAGLRGGAGGGSAQSGPPALSLGVGRT